MPHTGGDLAKRVTAIYWQKRRYSKLRYSFAQIYNPDAMLKMLSWWCDVAGVPFPVREIQG